MTVKLSHTVQPVRPFGQKVPPTPHPPASRVFVERSTQQNRQRAWSVGGFAVGGKSLGQTQTEHDNGGDDVFYELDGAEN